MFPILINLFDRTVLGSKKLHIAKFGNAVRTALVSSRLQASLRKEEKATILLLHLETRGQKAATVGFVRPRGNHKYVKGRVPFEQPKVFANKSNLASCIFMVTIMALSKMTFSSVESAKEERISYK